MHLRRARRGVWALTPGDREDNLRRLQVGPALPGFGADFKIYEMVRIDDAMSESMDGLELLSRAGWSTLDEESGHRISSGLAQAHRQYGARTLQAWSQVCAFDIMTAKDAKSEKLALLRSRLDVLSKRNVNYFSGRQLYLRELNEEVGRQKAIGRNVAADVSQFIMKRHSKRWHAMASAVRADFERRARQEQKELAAALQRQKRELRDQIAELERKIEEESRVSKPLRLSSVHLSQEEEI